MSYRSAFHIILGGCATAVLCGCSTVSGVKSPITTSSSPVTPSAVQAVDADIQQILLAGGIPANDPVVAAIQNSPAAPVSSVPIQVASSQVVNPSVGVENISFSEIRPGIAETTGMTTGITGPLPAQLASLPPPPSQSLVNLPAPSVAAGILPDPASIVAVEAPKPVAKPAPKPAARKPVSPVMPVSRPSDLGGSVANTQNIIPPVSVQSPSVVPSAPVVPPAPVVRRF